MFTRRELLTRGTTMLLLIPVVGCSSSSNNQPDGGSCAIESTSTVDFAHTHTLCVLTADLTSPPSAGVAYTTSNVGAHTHKVTLTAVNLTAINAGQAVTVTSTTDPDPTNGMVHSHNFTIQKL